MAGACEHSFLPATTVLLANGKTKPIKDVKAGDKVKATDPITGKTRARTVERLITIKTDKYFAKLTVKSNSHTATLTATDTHPFWVQNEHLWVNAGNLKPHMLLHTASGSTAVITAVHLFTHPYLTHDPTVATTHTDYVVAGGMPILVHNTSCPVSVNDAGRYADLKGVVGDGLEAHHMPQDGLGFAPRADGGSIVLTRADHMLTRTWGSRGAATKLAEAGLPFRTVLARDVWDLRQIDQLNYGDPGYFGKGIQGLFA